MDRIAQTEYRFSNYTPRKLEIVRALILYGINFIELFSPIVHPKEREDFDAIREVRDELITQKGYTFLLAHVRCHPDLTVRSRQGTGRDRTTPSH